MILIMVEEPLAILIKLADRLHNMRTVQPCSGIAWSHCVSLLCTGHVAAVVSVLQLCTWPAC